MEVRSGSVARAADLTPGTLFHLVGGKGTPLLLRATTGRPAGDRMVLLKWNEEPESVGVAMLLHAILGQAVSVEDTALDVDPTSVVDGEDGSAGAVFQRDDELYFPVLHNGRIDGFVNVETGEIVGMSGHWVAYEGWSITVPAAGDERQTVLSSQSLQPL